MHETFKEYVYNFDINDMNIMKKYYHSLRVEKICDQIARKENYNDTELELAKVIGLLHDYGRFLQWTKYHTYKDRDSIDHADLGVKLLFEDNDIFKYYKDINKYEIIMNSIKYHNKLDIPSNLSNDNIKFCKLIRDADKLDILYMFSSKELIFIEDGNVTSAVKDSFDNENLVNLKDQKTESDNIIKTLAFIYDLNYKTSLKYLADNKIVEQIYNNINDKDKYSYYFNKIIEYINKNTK